MSMRTVDRRAPRGRAGMTLVEVIVAIVLISATVVGMSAFAAKFTRTVADVRERGRASQLAVQRLEQVKAEAHYDSISVKYIGTETAIPGHKGFKRQTSVLRVGGTTGAVDDYRIVTVVVSSPHLADPVRKTTVISAY